MTNLEKQKLIRLKARIERAFPGRDTEIDSLSEDELFDYCYSVFSLQPQFVLTDLPSLLIVEIDRALAGKIDVLGDFGDGIIYGINWPDNDLSYFTKPQLRVIYTWLRIVAFPQYWRLCKRDILKAKTKIWGKISEINSRSRASKIRVAKIAFPRKLK